VFVISELVDADEVRDLFIRLQSGTALSRQQIRDAWPGAVGPFIERLAGKLNRAPSVTLFKQIDRRGTRNEEESDPYDSDRQFCAQLLCLFLARERDPLSQQSIGANELDKVYHENTTFDTEGEAAKRFQDALKNASEVFFVAFTKTGAGGKKRIKMKFRKLDVIAAFLLIQDLLRNSLFKFDKSFTQKLASHILVEATAEAEGARDRVASVDPATVEASAIKNIIADAKRRGKTITEDQARKILAKQLEFEAEFLA